MLLMRGYTLAFFFPKQSKYLTRNAPKTAAEIGPDTTGGRVIPDTERAAVSAASHFYRYF